MTFWVVAYITGGSTMFVQLEFFTEKTVAVEHAFIKPFYFVIRILFKHDFKGLFTREVTLAGG